MKKEENGNKIGEVEIDEITEGPWASFARICTLYNK